MENFEKKIEIIKQTENSPENTIEKSTEIINENLLESLDKTDLNIQSTIENLGQKILHSNVWEGKENIQKELETLLVNLHNRYDEISIIKDNLINSYNEYTEILKENINNDNFIIEVQGLKKLETEIIFHKQQLEKFEKEILKISKTLEWDNEKENKFQEKELITTPIKIFEEINNFLLTEFQKITTKDLKNDLEENEIAKINEFNKKIDFYYSFFDDNEFKELSQNFVHSENALKQDQIKLNESKQYIERREDVNNNEILNTLNQDLSTLSISHNTEKNNIIDLFKIRNYFELGINKDKFIKDKLNKINTLLNEYKNSPNFNKEKAQYFEIDHIKNFIKETIINFNEKDITISDYLNNKINDIQDLLDKSNKQSGIIENNENFTQNILNTYKNEIEEISQKYNLEKDEIENTILLALNKETYTSEEKEKIIKDILNNYKTEFEDLYQSLEESKKPSEINLTENDFQEINKEELLDNYLNENSEISIAYYNFQKNIADAINLFQNEDTIKNKIINWRIKLKENLAQYIYQHYEYDHDLLNKEIQKYLQTKQEKLNLLIKKYKKENNNIETEDFNKIDLFWKNATNLKNTLIQYQNRFKKVRNELIQKYNYNETELDNWDKNLEIAINKHIEKNFNNNNLDEIKEWIQNYLNIQSNNIDFLIKDLKYRQNKKTNESTKTTSTPTPQKNTDNIQTINSENLGKIINTENTVINTKDFAKKKKKENTWTELEENWFEAGENPKINYDQAYNEKLLNFIKDPDKANWIKYYIRKTYNVKLNKNGIKKIYKENYNSEIAQSIDTAMNTYDKYNNINLDLISDYIRKTYYKNPKNIPNIKYKLLYMTSKEILKFFKHIEKSTDPKINQEINKLINLNQVNKEKDSHYLHTKKNFNNYSQTKKTQFPFTLRN